MLDTTQRSLTLLSLFSAGLSLVAGLPTSSPPVVDLGYAQYQGVFNATTDQTAFLGIRYAAPPIGAFSVC